MLFQKVSLVDVEPHVRTDDVSFGVYQAEAVGVTAFFDAIEKELFNSHSLGVGHVPPEEVPFFRIRSEPLGVVLEYVSPVSFRVDRDANKADRFVFVFFCKELHLGGLSRAAPGAGREEKADDVGLSLQRFRGDRVTKLVSKLKLFEPLLFSSSGFHQFCKNGSLSRVRSRTRMWVVPWVIIVFYTEART